MKPITDRTGRVIAYENNVSAYRQEIRSRSNVLLGYYNPVEDKTFNRAGGAVSNQGDTRASLIPPPK
jgi:hypothetical protein